ncbi:MAG: endonuclease [Bacteroidales bacterium]|nr:endonuclease [Bacteroidales bacterium]
MWIIRIFILSTFFLLFTFPSLQGRIGEGVTPSLLERAGEKLPESVRVQQQRIMFWNVENAFWPSDDSLHQDDEFTPEGIRHWTHSRLRQKLLQLSRVIVAAGDGMAPMLVGLAEVEGDSVMHYWTHSTPLWNLHYNYIISDGPDVRGIQTALLYQPTDFKLLHADFHRITLPEGNRPTRDVLHAAGRVVSGDTLDVIVCHLPSRLGGTKQSQSARDVAHRTVMHVADSVRLCRQHPNIVIMGDMNDNARKSNTWWGKDYLNLMIPLQKSLKHHPSAFGSHKYQGEWGFLDQFVVNVKTSPFVTFSNPRVFYLPFMLTEDTSHLGHRPARSYYGYQYEGGYSDHLPILLDFDVYF